MNFYDTSRQKDWDHLNYVIAAPGATNILLLDGQYDPDQLWLDLGQVFIYKPLIEEVVEKKRVRYRKKQKWEPIPTTERDYYIYDYIPTHFYDYFFNNTKSEYVKQYRILFPEGRLLQINTMSESETAAIFVLDKMTAAQGRDWLKNNTISFWSISTNSRGELTVRLESDDDAIRFKLEFGKLAEPAHWWKRSKPD
jgi:hypothetical protein